MIAMRRADVADLNARARTKMHDAGRLGIDVDFTGKPFASGDELVVARNDRRLGVLNGDRGHVLDAADSHLDVRLDQGRQVRLPATFISDGHVDHGYATTAHKAQGATVDEAFVLGSQEAYREWGYTALSRHRDQSTYYLAAPKTFVNREPAPLDSPEQLTVSLEQNLADTRRHELATELADRFGVERPTPPPEHDLDVDVDVDMDFGM
jgi:ATP-dependent exoDNAse (exonuclease V) alpha subunit